MALITVDIGLEDFDDQEIIEEVKRRGLRPDNDLVKMAEEKGFRIIQTGIGEPYSIMLGDKKEFSGTGKATVIILEGE